MSAHYVKCVLDEIFGNDNFLNEIVLVKYNKMNDTQIFGSIHDIIICTKTANILEKI